MLCVMGLAVSLADGTPTTSHNLDESTFALLSRTEGTLEWTYTCSSVAFEQTPSTTRLLTASHCIMPHRTYALVPNQSLEWMAEVSVERISVTADMAVLSVRRLLPVTPIGKNPNIGDTVVSVGWPRGSPKNRYFGFVSREMTEDRVPILVVYMPGLEPGMSGSGLFCVNQQSLCGLVIGIYTTSPAFGAAEPISQFYHAKWLPSTEVKE